MHTQDCTKNYCTFQLKVNITKILTSSSYLKYKETKNWERSINSLTTVAGECMPRNGTMSTCNQFSTAEPTTAPATSPPIVITLAFPASGASDFFELHCLAIARCKSDYKTLNNKSDFFVLSFGKLSVHIFCRYEYFVELWIMARTCKGTLSLAKVGKLDLPIALKPT